MSNGHCRYFGNVRREEKPFEKQKRLQGAGARAQGRMRALTPACFIKPPSAVPGCRAATVLPPALFESRVSHACCTSGPCLILSHHQVRCSAGAVPVMQRASVWAGQQSGFLSQSPYVSSTTSTKWGVVDSLLHVHLSRVRRHALPQKGELREVSCGPSRLPLSAAAAARATPAGMVRRGSKGPGGADAAQQRRQQRLPVEPLPSCVHA